MKDKCEDFTGGTVRVVREKEIRLYGNVGRDISCWRRGMVKGKDERSA
jgi:hypothetical protein